MKKRLVLLLSLLLALSVLLQGCLMPFPSDRFDYLTEETTEPTKPTDRGEPAEADSYLPYDEFPRPEEAELEPVAFEDMDYTRPDAAALCKALGKDVEPVFGPNRAGDIRDSNADISKARELLGYDPDYDFAKGIALAIDWYKANL